MKETKTETKYIKVIEGDLAGCRGYLTGSAAASGKLGVLVYKGTEPISKYMDRNKIREITPIRPKNI